MKFGNTTAQMKRRIIAIILILSLLGPTVLIARLFTLQVVQAEDLQKRAARQQMRVTSISAQRGTIYDRNGEILAMSGTVWTVYLSPVDIDDEEERELVIKGLSRILDVDEDTIREKSHRNTYYEIIKKKIERPLADEVTEFLQENSIGCVGLEEDYKRYYPYGTLASTVLGFTGSENQGAYGIESYYDKVLSGTNGQVVSAKNAWGTDMPFEYEKMYEAENGNDLILTIDANIQRFVDQHLEQAVIEHDVQNKACAIVMDVKTGEILAMSTKPDFDPNNPNEIYDAKVAEELSRITNSEEYKTALQEAQFAQWRNKAISDPYEPGSVFKIITASAALEEKVVDLGTSFSCYGVTDIAGQQYHCWKLEGHGDQNFSQTLENSCNPAFIAYGQLLGAENFRKYFEAFGLTEITGVDLPGEAGSIYHPMSEFGITELSSSSFGQTFKVTALQLITAISAAVNGGELMQPYVVKQVVDQNKNVVSETVPVTKRQVISNQTSFTMATLCENVVAYGSGRSGGLPGFRIGGKTGTSEKLGAGDSEWKILSFAAFAPANDPEIAVLVMLDEPPLDNPYGSVIAAPIVKNMLADILPYLGYEADVVEGEDTDVKVPNLVEKMLEEAQSALIDKGLKARIVGDGDTVLAQVPAENSTIPYGGTVILYTDETELEETVKVPNVLGRTSRQANATLLNAGLNIKIVGSFDDNVQTQVVAQSPMPEEEVVPGTVVTVTIQEVKTEETADVTDTES
ncbi:MAG: PASTA domain-containing protein [Oscillospiraceae bacterium]|nr:PASTA domain-containing protein [Oscillospiraceae bacterium]